VITARCLFNLDRYVTELIENLSVADDQGDSWDGWVLDMLEKTN